MTRLSDLKRRCRWQLALLLAGFLLLPISVWAWNDINGNTINPRQVERIKDGVSTRHEMLLYFGDPQEIERTSEGPIFKYASYKDALLRISPKSGREPAVDNQGLSHQFILDQDKKIKLAPKEKEGKILRSTLVIRFKPDGETVMSHEYQEH